MASDTERLDWLERMGNGIALIHNDECRWAIGGDGVQNIPGPDDALSTTYWIEPEWFKPTVREAIDHAMASPDFNVEVDDGE